MSHELLQEGVQLYDLSVVHSEKVEACSQILIAQFFASTEAKKKEKEYREPLDEVFASIKESLADIQVPGATDEQIQQSYSILRRLQASASALFPFVSKFSTELLDSYKASYEVLGVFLDAMEASMKVNAQLSRIVQKLNSFDVITVHTAEEAEFAELCLAATIIRSY